MRAARPKKFRMLAKLTPAPGQFVRHFICGFTPPDAGLFCSLTLFQWRGTEVGSPATAWFVKVRLSARFVLYQYRNADQSSMPDPNQTDLLGGMIARLEKANARAYQQLARPGERGLESDQDGSRHASDKQDPAAAPELQSSRARGSFIVLIALLLAAAGVTAFAWELSHGDATKSFGRSVNPWVLPAVPQAQTAPRDGVPASPPISPEITQRLLRMADDLANMQQQIEQLKASQEQTIRSDAALFEHFRTSQEKMALDNAKVVEQFSAALTQMDSKNAAIVKQLKAGQEQLIDLVSLRTASSVRKPFVESRLDDCCKRKHRRRARVR
jgi:hypothetical protein